MNTAWLEYLAEKSILEPLPKEEIIIKLKKECGLDCNPHFKKELLIQTLLEAKYGKQEEPQHN